MTKKNLMAIILSSIWISLSEFFRNEYLIKSFWIKHYENLGIIFPSAPINGAIWGVWSIVYAGSILIFSKRYNLIESFFIAWINGFVLMWLVLWNMSVFPLSILFYAIPLSALEAFIATWIIKRITNILN